MKRRWIALAPIALVACTPAERLAWLDWHAEDPDAALAFLDEYEATKPNYRNNHPARWEAIAWCESGRQWHLRATNSTGTYGGGLMIRDNVWRAYGGLKYAPTADRASKEQQIDIAERILDDVGWKAWDCA